MSRQVRRSLTLALAGLLGGLGLVLALFGGGDALRRMADRPEVQAPNAAAPGPDAGARTLADPRIDPRIDSWADPRGQSGGPGAAAGAPETADPARPGGTRSADTGTPDGKAAAAGPAPSFDIVRVEPNGEAVVAGRGPPNTVVEMLVDGRPVARALADPNGQFAIVPPALPAGSSAIQLRTRDADGRETRSQQSVAVEVAPGRDRRPLVALTAPDRPTVVLSQPGAPEPAAGVGAKPGSPVAGGDAAGARATAAKSAPGRSGPGKSALGMSAPGKSAPSVSASGKAQPARIVSVDAQEGGRLYVTAAGTPGSDLRLYLNDTLIAPGRVGTDGTVTFTIGRGVKPGPYQVRVDQIEPGTGTVRGRAEVPFSVPEPTRLAAREAAPATGAEGRGGPAAKPGAPEPRAAAEGRPQEVGRAGPGGAGPRGAGPAPAGAAARRGAPGPGSAEPDAAGPAAMPPGMAAGRGSPTPSALGSPPPGAEAAAAPAPAGAVFVPEISTARISRGDNLWRISQRTYGRGERYTVIYDANQEQIRDPDLIYPGQIFVLPTDKRG